MISNVSITVDIDSSTNYENWIVIFINNTVNRFRYLISLISQEDLKLLKLRSVKHYDVII